MERTTHKRRAIPLSEEPGRVLYQIYVESFQDDALNDGHGDFAGLQKRLDYLQELGITGIMLMPITDSKGQGYITQDFSKLREDYGGAADPKEREKALRAMIAAAHARNIKVFIDITLNHISDRSDWFMRSQLRLRGYEDFFVWSDRPRAGWRLPWDMNSTPGDVWHFSRIRGQYYYGLFGKLMPDLNHLFPQVQTRMIRVFMKYAEMGIDGFRIDAAKHLVEGEDNLNPVEPANVALLEMYLSRVRQRYPHVSFLLEAWSREYHQFEPYLPHAGDVVFDFAFMETLRDSIKFNHPWGVRQTLRHLQDVQGRFNPGNRVVLSGNHDVPRLRTYFSHDQRCCELALALTCLLPFPPLIYYGDEIFMPGDYIRAAEEERTINEASSPMAWNNGPNAGFAHASVTLGNAWNKKLHADWATCNVESEQHDPESMLNFVRHIIRIRKTLPIDNDTRLWVDDSDHSDPVLSYAMEFRDGSRLVALMNFSPVAHTRSLTKLQCTLDQVRGDGVFRRASRASLENEVELQPYGMCIWQTPALEPSTPTEEELVSVTEE